MPTSMRSKSATRIHRYLVAIGRLISDAELRFCSGAGPAGGFGPVIEKREVVLSPLEDVLLLDADG